MNEPHDITHILKNIEQGDLRAADQLLPLVYEELRKLAASRMSLESIDHTLQATALVHEAYLRLVKGDRHRVWDGRRHFFAAAAESMRRIVIDAVRHRQSARRGGNLTRADLPPHELTAPAGDARMLAIDEYLEELENIDKSSASVVKLRLYAGMSISEAAESLEISRTTAYQNWAYGRAWLKSKVEGAGFLAGVD